jgi:4-carboxymuconolactone decarboxylase
MNKRSEAFEAGVKIRKQVLGEAYVDKAFADADAFNLPFQEILTEFGWGAIWTRPGLTLKTRSMLTLAICVALNRPHEIKLHLRGAVRNGCTDEEIRELLLHAFIYCGGPAAVDGFNAVKAFLPDIRAQEGDGRNSVSAAVMVTTDLGAEGRKQRGAKQKKLAKRKGKEK